MYPLRAGDNISHPVFDRLWNIGASIMQIITIFFTRYDMCITIAIILIDFVIHKMKNK